MLQKKAVGNRSEMFDKAKSAADKIIQIRLDTGQALVLATQIANELKIDYSKFFNLFLSEYGITIERLYMMRIIEKVKELLVYTDQPLAQIARALGYEDTSLLSDLLKANTGLTSSHFKAVRKGKLEIKMRQSATRLNTFSDFCECML